VAAAVNLPPLGAHISIAGGLSRAPERATAIGATAIQIFTKQPQRWAEPRLADASVAAFRAARTGAEIECLAVHDSYLINLASHRPELVARSQRSFEAELHRCHRLGAEFLVTHPGNATGGDRVAAARQNADAIGSALDAEDGPTTVLLETTAGSGSALGWRFEEIAGLIERFPSGLRDRIGVCLDTAHVFAAGYDIRRDPDGVIDEFDRIIGLGRLQLFHMNDSRAPLGSRVDRHAHIGQGEIGEDAFGRLMRHPGLLRVPRILETPKDEDATATDRMNLAVLKRVAAGPSR
jgi:deoxyribonuclease-4